MPEDQSLAVPPEATAEIGPDSPIWRSVRTDPVFLAAVAILGTFVALYYLPLVSAKTLEMFITTWADPLLIVLAAVAFQYGKRQLHPEERSFWNLMTASFICTSGGSWLGLLVPADEWRVIGGVAEEIAFLLQFVLMFLAISLNPHTPSSVRSLDTLRFRVESAGTVIFAALIAFYFIFVPFFFGNGHGDTLPPRVMFVAVNPMLIFSFFYIASFSASRRWTAVYRLFGLGWLLWLTIDTVEFLTHLELIPQAIPYGTLYDFLWYVPFVLAVTAARIGRRDLQEAVEPAPSLPARNPRQIRYLFGPLVVYTMSLPLIHFALSAAGMLDGATRGPREVSVFFGLLLLGSLTLVNEKLSERQRRRTQQENKRLAAFPIKNPNPFMIFLADGTLKYINPAATRTMKELGIESMQDFLPSRHSDLLTECMITRSGYRDIEVGVKGKVFSFGYYPNPSGVDVFVYVVDITERKRAEGKLKFDALHDTLTGLPNRTLAMEILSRSIERARRNDSYVFALLFLDLNRFKLVNDSFGHLAGDRFLVEISQRIARSLRNNDIVARFGGDEFVIILDDVHTASRATRTAARIQRELHRPLKIAGQEVVTSACIGIAMSDASRTQPEDYLRDADIAMYRAKSRNEEGLEVFDEQMHEEVVQQLRLENGLRRAIEEQEFILHYQPYVSLADGKILGFEALVRWENPEHGMVPPGSFIPLAEDVGLIVPIGWWVMQQACDQLQRWVALLGPDDEFTLSVNVSTRQLTRRDFVKKLLRLLERYDFDRSRLRLEITESLVTDLGPPVIELLQDIKRLGVQLAVDDFGTGYSSLSYLRRFPVDVLKIDRSFINALEHTRQDVAIVRAITTLANDLDLVVVAEGVETFQQSNRLRALGCKVAQGFLFSRPVEAPVAEAMLRRKFLLPAHDQLAAG